MMKNILVADDHDLVRDTVAAYLGSVEEFAVVTASDLSGAEKQLHGSLPIDLVILDYHMPGMNGLEGLDRIRRRFPHIRVALMSGVATKEIANAAMERGAHGFLPKSTPAASMVNAIRFVLSGERYFPFGFADGTRNAAAAKLELSNRECETLQGLTQGLTNKQIARDLGVQEVTVKLHVKNILAKLGVQNRTQAALAAKELQLF